jgi:hypothetical protein
MLELALYGISIAFSLLAWGIVVARYVWPHLSRLPRADALRPLLLLHVFRFIGLAFLVPGIVSPELPAAFAAPAAYGDLIAAVLALLALVALPSALGIPLVWLFNLWGTADLLFAFYRGNLVDLDPGQLGCRILHCGHPCAAAPHHTWPRIPAPITGRCPHQQQGNMIPHRIYIGFGAALITAVSFEAQMRQMEKRFPTMNGCVRRRLRGPGSRQPAHATSGHRVGSAPCVR